MGPSLALEGQARVDKRNVQSAVFIPALTLFLLFGFCLNAVLFLSVRELVQLRRFFFLSVPQLDVAWSMVGVLLRCAA